MNKVVEKPKKYSLVERTPAATFEEERLHRKQRLAATFRLFSRYGFDQGLAGIQAFAENVVFRTRRWRYARCSSS